MSDIARFEQAAAARPRRAPGMLPLSYLSRLLWLGLAVFALPLPAAEKKFNFADIPENQLPPGFRSTVTGKGKPGDWRVVLEEVAPMLEPLSTQAPSVARKSVLAQLSKDPTDEHFPLLIYEDEVFSDFKFTTKFKTVSGVMEQMAGLAFRIQNETNYYVVRASSLGNTFRFYKVVNGQRGTIIGPEIKIPSGQWHEMTVECKGNEIRCLLDGKEAIPSLMDSTFSRGKVGFWTKSDSVSYFMDARIDYKPHEVPAQKIVREVGDRYGRLKDLRIYVTDLSSGKPRLIAKLDEKGEHAADAPTDLKSEGQTLAAGKTFYGKTRKAVNVLMPLRDRNGEVMAAVRVIMETFPGQTEQNAIIRATPVIKAIQARAQTQQELLE